MRTFALIRKSLVLIASLAALSVLGGPGNASATGTTVSPVPTPIWVVQRDWFNSGVTLNSAVDSSQTSILVNNTYVIIEGMLMRVGQETMLVTQFIDGSSINDPDTLVVERAQNGTTAADHTAGAGIKTQAVSADIYAYDVTDPDGLGGFQVYMTLPPGVQYVQMVPQTAWLESTGRWSWCDGPFQGSGYWTTSCVGIGDPLGPRGSGLIARITLLPSQDVETMYSIKFAATLVDRYAHAIPTTTSNLMIKVLKCPDANLDGTVNVGDALMVALNDLDRGTDSGATLVSQVNGSQTEMQISDQSLLLLGGTTSIDAEQMTVQALHEGTPDTMTAVRARNRTPAKPHSAGAHIYLATDPGSDGMFGYTAPRDVNHDGVINVGDSLIVALVPDSMVCPAP